MRHALRRWWLPILAVVMAIVCLRLGWWQLDRLEGRRAANDEIEAGLAHAPVDIEQALAEGTPYRPVTATGTYDRDRELVLYGRPFEGNPGDHVLTPLTLGDGTSVLVDRGWIPSAADAGRGVPPAAAAPAGDVEVSGVLMPGETGDAFGDQDPATARLVRAIDIARLNADAGYDLAPSYILLGSQEPAEAALPIPVPLPPRDDGPHLSYAIQWFAFATIAVVGAIMLIRRRAQVAGDQATHAPGPTENG